MLPPFIIEQIRKREEELAQPAQIQPHLELPLVQPSRRIERREEETGERGIVILELCGPSRD